jgi:hypothetical protein
MRFAVPDRYAFSARISEVNEFCVSETLLLAAGSTSNIAETFTSAPEILVQMQQYFAQAKQQQGAIRFDNKSL